MRHWAGGQLMQAECEILRMTACGFYCSIFRIKYQFVHLFIYLWISPRTSVAKVHMDSILGFRKSIWKNLTMFICYFHRSAAEDQPLLLSRSTDTQAQVTNYRGTFKFNVERQEGRLKGLTRASIMQSLLDLLYSFEWSDCCNRTDGCSTPVNHCRSCRNL